MPYKKLVRTFPFKTEDLYGIITDVESYPAFVPHCSFVSVQSRSEKEIIAAMGIEYHTFLKKFEVSYISKIQLLPQAYSLCITNANNDLFRELWSSWKLIPCLGGTEVVYEISFTLQNSVLNFTLSSILVKYSDIIMEAFAKRAQTLLKKIQ